MQASPQVLNILSELFKEWSDWEHNRTYYIQTLLPELMADPASGTTNERGLLTKLKAASDSAEWENMVTIADNLDSLKDQMTVFHQAINEFLEKGDFASAEAYISANGSEELRKIYESKRTKEISKKLIRIEEGYKTYSFERADRRIDAIRQYMSSDQSEYIEEKRKHYLKQFHRGIVKELEEVVAKYNFDKAESIYHQYPEAISREKFNELIKAAEAKKEAEELAQYVRRIEGEIEQLLRKYEFDKAKERYELIVRHYPEERYLNRLEFYRKQRLKELLLSRIHKALKSGDYRTADSIFLESDLLDENEYLDIKASYLSREVKRRYQKEINREKALALGSSSQNLLISARAGSGKTMTLACKTSLLIDLERIHPDQIMILAFNKSAAKEIRERVAGEYGKSSFENARTFHSLADQIVQPEKEYLYDDTRDNLTGRMTNFVQQLLKEKIVNPDFLETMYYFFRSEMREIEQAGFLLGEEAYREFRRNLRQYALHGERAKSAGEKYIADYHFEHDIRYQYEKAWFWGDLIYRPDFSIFHNQEDYIIEHWGIDEQDHKREVPSWWNKSWQEYHEEMNRKREFWAEKGVLLIETWDRDVRRGRGNFEKLLEKRLKSAGIYKEKLPEHVIIERLKENDIKTTRMAKLFSQFIQRAKTKMWEPAEIQRSLRFPGQECRNKGPDIYTPVDEREAVFIDLALRVYKEYEAALDASNYLDFNDVLHAAVEEIHRTEGACRIRLGASKKRSIPLNKLKVILIDEYQDFSEQFYMLVDAIRIYNPGLRFVCVGDDWQAINGFAGSDLKYFDGFSSFSRTPVVLTS